jgi:hypothetical protein
VARFVAIGFSGPPVENIFRDASSFAHFIHHTFDIPALLFFRTIGVPLDQHLDKVTDKCDKEWNFRKFRVIVTLRNDERRTNLLNEVATKYKHRMFWLTHEDLYRHDISAAIFQTPKDFATTIYGFENPQG